MRLSFLLYTQAALLLAGIRSSSAIRYNTRFPGVSWDDDRWIINNNNLDPGHYQSRLSLANGYLGINVASLGPFFEADQQVDGDNINGWPVFDRRQTFATISGFYDWQDRTHGSNYPWLYQYGSGETLLSGIPHWAGLLVESDGVLLNASTNPTHILNFSSSLNIKLGLMTWKYVWTPAGKKSPIRIQYDMFVHKLYVNQAAVQVTLQLDENVSDEVDVLLHDVLDGDCALRTEFAGKGYEHDSATIWSAVRPLNITNVTSYIYSTLKAGPDVHLNTRGVVSDNIIYGANLSSIAQSVKISMKPGKRYQVAKFVGGASSDAFDDPQAVARNASLSGAASEFTNLLKSHADEWASILTVDSVDSYALPNGSLPNDKNIQELHVIAVLNTFQLLQNTLGKNAIAAANSIRLGRDSIPVCGLASDCYGGLIFWDAEVWIAPGLQVSHPGDMQQIVRYRQETFPQAKSNIESAYSSSKNQSGRFSTGGATYPWTSGRYGHCTPTGPCFDYEYHLNGDIGLLFHNYLAITGDEEYFKEYLLPISNAVAWFYGELLDFDETTGVYMVRNATDPDEYANNVDAAGFTTALIQSHFNTTNMFNEWYGFPVNHSWNEKGARTELPINKNASIILEYASMDGSISVKQADVVLIDDVLNYPNPYSLSQLDYYASKQSQNGPGMTYGVFSIVANRISPSGCSSYTYHLYGSQPYARAPWFQFSEQLIDNFEANGGTHPAFPFLTGMGGTHRVGMFGYLGLRIFPDRLDVDPSLPPQIQLLNYRTFYWQGHGINATSNATHTVISRLPREKYSLSTANSTYATKPIPLTLGTRPGKYYLDFDSPVEITNRQIGRIDTVPGNILQCIPTVYSNEAYLPGQFPLAAIDGAASTRWQPAFARSLAYLTVNLGESQFYPIKFILFDWASNPPSHYEVLFSNSSLPPFTDTEKAYILNVTSSNDIKISEPWDPIRAIRVETYKGNQTNITLEEPVWTGRYVHLGVLGNLDDESPDASGATIAEWSMMTENLEKPARRKWEHWDLADNEDEFKVGKGSKNGEGGHEKMEGEDGGSRKQKEIDQDFTIQTSAETSDNIHQDMRNETAIDDHMGSYMAAFYGTANRTANKILKHGMEVGQNALAGLRERWRGLM